jgi:hypothetical protein
MATLTLRNVDDDMLEVLKLMTEENTASKALVTGASGYVQMTFALEGCHNRIAYLEQQLEQANQRLANASEAARLLLESVDQIPLFE